MSLLNTTNPIAIRALMSETIFGIESLDQDAILEEPILDAAPTEITIMGGNRRNVLFITGNASNPFFSKEAELAFMKTLGALKLDLEDVAVVNSAEERGLGSFERLKDKLEPRICVFLGLNPQKLGLNTFALNILGREGDIEILYSFSFEEMLTDTGKKKMFWEAIKLMNF